MNIERLHLINAIARVRTVINSRNTIPVLGMVALECRKDTLTVRATDLDIHASVTIPVDDGQDMSVAVEAGVLLTFLKSGKDDTVIITAKDAKLSVKCGRSRAAIDFLDSADLPMLEPVTGGAEINAGTLVSSLKSVAFAASDDGTRYYLQGVAVYGGSVENCAATNGHVLAWRGDAGAENPVIVPSGVIDAFASVAVVDDTVTYAVNDNRVSMVGNRYSVVGKLIDATYPDISRVIPKGGAHTAVVSAEELRSAAAVVNAFENGKDRAIILDFENKEARSSPRSPNSYAKELDVSGTGPAVGVNAKYLLDICSALGDGELTISYDDPQSPLLITGSGDVKVVLMPMRI